jgi:hypothetical protein
VEHQAGLLGHAEPSDQVLDPFGRAPARILEGVQLSVVVEIAVDGAVRGGEGGFFDAIASSSKKVAERYLSLDQAMIMGALGNVIGDDVLQRYFTKGEVAARVRPVIAPEVFGA